MNMQDMVQEFHEKFGAFIGNSGPMFSSEQIRETRKRLLDEEYQEYLEGEEENDLVKVSDGLGDMLYIIFGTAVSYGIPLVEIFKEIHLSNMSKMGEDGNPIKRDDGKILKGPNYFKPRIREILESHGMKS